MQVTEPSAAVDTPSRPRAIRHCRLPDDPRVAFLLYVPETAGDRAPLFVTVHGISRNAAEHAKLFAPYAEACGAVLAAPIFDEQTYGKYQRLVSRRPDVLRSDDALRRIVDRVDQLASVNAERVYLFGFSGGGQFAHRFAMAYPERVASTVVGAAGWYTLPDPELAYPYGIGENPKLPGLSFEPERFLRTPFQVLVGPRDVSRDWALRKSEKLDGLQGQTRVERGERWIAAMREAATRHGVLAPSLRFDLLPGGRHSFAKTMKRHDLAAATFAAFGLTPTGSDPADGDLARESHPITAMSPQ